MEVPNKSPHRYESGLTANLAWPENCTLGKSGRKQHRVASEFALICPRIGTRGWNRLGRNLEARAGIEPAHKGFADLSLTTWVPRLGRASRSEMRIASIHRSQSGWRRRADWSGRRDLNSRPSPWQGDALPLSYSRLSQF